MKRSSPPVCRIVPLFVEDQPAPRPKVSGPRAKWIPRPCRPGTRSGSGPGRVVSEGFGSLPAYRWWPRAAGSACQTPEKLTIPRGGQFGCFDFVGSSRCWCDIAPSSPFSRTSPSTTVEHVVHLASVGLHDDHMTLAKLQRSLRDGLLPSGDDRSTPGGVSKLHRSSSERID